MSVRTPTSSEPARPPSRAKVTPDEALREIIARLAAEPPEVLGLGSSPIDRVMILSVLDRPYSRCARIQLQTGDRTWRGYCKLALPSPTLEDGAPGTAERVRRECALLRELPEHFRGGDSAERDRLGVVQLVACYDEYPALVTEEVPGRDLLSELKVTAGRLASRADLAGAEAACGRCGEWLRRFQQMPISDEPPAVEAVRAYNQRRLDKLARERPAGIDETWCQGMSRYVNRLADAVAAERARPALTHGDFALANVIVSERRVVVLDFSMHAAGWAAYDPTHFAHHLRQLAWHPRFSRRTVGRLTGAFWDGYGATPTELGAAGRLCEAQHALCQLSRISTFRSAAWTSRLYDRYVARRQKARLEKLCRRDA